MSLDERFWSKVDKTDGCWNWIAVRNPHGYGQFTVHHGTVRQAHRLAYLDLVGPVPVGLELDHLCRNRACVNPAHLEPVSHRENVRRGAQVRYGDTCRRGHARTIDNAYIRPDTGAWMCRPCTRERDRGRASGWARQRAAYREEVSDDNAA